MPDAKDSLSGATTPGSRAEPIYSTIYSVLKDHLERRALTAGLMLGQANIARVFNVSRVPAGIALSRLFDEGLIETFEGRGYVVPGGVPVRADLFGAGLHLPASVVAPAANRREQIYPEVEHAVAVCLAYGRFLLNETALAQHYDVSRTIAHEVLTQLERAGVIEQDSNNRWYAGPLTAHEFEHHYEMRWLLEPQALRHAFPLLDPADIRARIEKLATAKRDALIPMKLEELEADLHLHTLSPCSNSILLNTVRRSQRILIATHSTFVEYQRRSDIEMMALEHGQIYEALLAGDADCAAAILEGHLHRSVNVNLDMLSRLSSLPENLLPPYLVQVK